MDQNSIESKRLFIIDCDAGTDDAQAIFMALAAKDVTILAITTVHGNTSARQVAKNVLRVLQIADRLEVPVFVGSDKSLLGNDASPSNYHGSNGFGDVPDTSAPDEQLIQSQHSVDAILCLTKEHPGEINLVCLGPLTNIASCIRRDPCIGTRIKQCVIMGGNYQGKGNITTSAEFNFHSDPEAAHMVLGELGCPIIMVCWELCENNPLPWTWYQEFIEQDTEIIRFITMLERYAVEKHYLPRFQQGLPMVYELADQFAVAIALDMTVAQKCVDVYATVEIMGQLTKGQMVVDWKQFLGKSHNIKLVLEVDVSKTVDMLMKGCVNKLFDC